MRTLVLMLLVSVVSACGNPSTEKRNGKAEMEPNDGATATEHEVLAIDETWTGAIGTKGDVDVYFVDAAPGQRLVATVTPVGGSTLSPHVTVMDAGRGGDAAGGDYVKLATGSLEWITMGQGGYYVIVRDARNVAGGEVGSADLRYTLAVTTQPLALQTVSDSANGSGTLTSAGAIDVYELDAKTGGDLIFDVKHRNPSSAMDARIVVYSKSEMDWVARQDDRAQNDKDPLVDAPIGAGMHWLIVENIAESAAALSYDYELSFQP